ncbi:MAG: CdaR family protein [Eubacterium sp.]|nr:CdaR family protein [Eubacterium sp.]
MERNKKIPMNEKVVRLIFAIVLAILLWAYINGSSNDIIVQDINSIPVTLTNTEVLKENNLVLSDNRGYYVNLRVKGTDRSLTAIDRKEITAEVDLSNITSAGSYDQEIVVKGLSNSVILEEVNPQTIRLEVDSIVDSEREVSVVTEGKPAGDNVVVSAASEAKVQVTGASAALARIDKLIATADVSGMSEDGTQYQPVVAYDADGNIIEDLVFTPNVVAVDITIGKTKEIPISTPQIVGNAAEGYKATKISVSPSEKLVGAKASLLSSIASISVDAVDISGASKTVTKEVNLKLPEGASFLDGNSKVTVTVDIEPVVERSFTVDKIDIRNLGNGLRVTKVQDSSVVVKLSGISSELNQLKNEDISAYIDLSGQNTGQVEVDIKVDAPSGTTVQAISPSKTTVTIE